MSQESELNQQQLDELRKQKEDLHRDLLTMQGDYEDLLKKMQKWMKTYLLLYKQSGNGLQD